MQYFTIENLAVFAVVVVGIVFGLKWLGVWGKAKDAVYVKANNFADGLTTGLDKKKAEVAQMAGLLDQMADQMTTLDGKYGAAQAQVETAQRQLDQAVDKLHNVQAVIADPAHMTADEAATLNSKAQDVAKAESNLKAKTASVTALAGQCAKLHDDYTARKAEYDTKAAEIPAAEVKQLMTTSNNIAAAFGKKQEEFARRAQTGSGGDEQIDEALSKSQANATLHGGMTDTDRAAAKAAAASSTADILARFGKGAGTPAA